MIQRAVSARRLLFFVVAVGILFYQEAGLFAATLTKTTQADFEAAGSLRTNLDTATTPGDMFLPKGGTPASTTSAGPALGASNGSGAHSIVRSDGKILIINGSTANGLLTDLYDPSTNTMSAGPSFNGTIVSTGGHSIKLPDGRFLIIHAGGTPTNVTSIYNNETSGTLALGPTLTANANGHSFTIKNTDGTFTLFHVNGLTSTSRYSPLGINGCAAANGCIAAGPTTPSALVNGAFAIKNSDGTYLITVGNSTSTFFYDPTARTFSSAGAPTLSGTIGRGAHALQKDADTMLIFHAGVGAGTTGTTLYNRNAKTTAAGPTTPTSVGDGNFSVELSDGRYLIFPGNASTANFFYTPSSNTFSTVGAPTDAAARLGGHAIHLPDKVSGASYANAGKYLLVMGASTTTRLYDAGWYATGTYESEGLNPAGITGWTTLNWTAGADPTLSFQVRTATTQAGLSAATYGNISNGGDIPTASGNGGLWLQIKANHSRLIPTYPDAGESIARGIATANYSRTFAQPDVQQIDANYNTGATISGTVYTDEGVTNIGAGKTIRLIINGASAGTAVTDGSGAYSITPASLSAGDAILVYVDGDVTYQGTTASVSNGGSLSGFDIYAAHLITRQDNGGALTNADLSTAKGAYVDTDILYSVSAGNLTVSGAATELYLPTGHSFAPGGNVTTPNMESKGTFNGGSGNIDSNGALVISGGAFTATSGTTNIGGNYTLSAGTFTHNNGTVTFDGTSGTKQITPGGQSFYNITFNDAAGTATYQLQGALTVANDLTVTDGILDTKAGSNFAINVTRDFVQSGGRVLAQSSTVTVGGNFTANGAELSTGFNSASLVLTGTGGLNYSALASSWDNGFNNLTVGQSGNTTTLNNDVAVLNNLTVGSGTFTGPGTKSVYLKKVGTPLVFDPASTISVPYLSFFASGNQNLPTITNGYDSNIRLAFNGWTLTQLGAITINAGKSLLLDGDSSASRVQTYNTGGFALNVGGNIQVGFGGDTGTKTFNATNSTVTVGGNIDIRSGTTTFTNTSSTVILNGAALQTVLMSGESFNNLTITNASVAGVQFLDGFSAANFTDTTAASKLTFKNGATYTVSGTLTLTGSLGSEIVLLSDSAGTRFTFNVTGGAQTVSYVNVKDSQASTNNITANNSINSGGNDTAEAAPHWIITATVSGTVYTDEGVTNIGAGKTVRLLVNGASAGTGVTDASGNFSVTAGFNPGDALLAFIDGNDGTTTDGTTVTVTNGGALAGFNIYVDHLIARHDNSGNLTNALMNTAKGAYSDTEILYSVSAGNLTVSGAATELYLPTGHSFAPAADVTTPAMKSLGTFNGGAGSIDINGALTVSGGTYTATSGMTYVATNLTISGATFIHNSGTFTLDTSDKTVNTGTAAFNNVILNMNTRTLTVTGTMTVSGNLTLTAISTINGGTLAVAGNVTTTTTPVYGSATILFEGAGAQALLVNGAGGAGAVPGVSINKPSGTLTIQDNIEIDGSSGWTYTAGTVDAGTSTVVFAAGNKTVNSGAMSFNNVTINIGPFDFTVTGTMTVAGNLSVSNVNNINTGTIAVGGNVTVTSTTGWGSGNILFNGTGAQILQVDGAGGSGALPGVSINKGSGTLTLKDTVSINGTGGWTYTAGTVDAGTSTIAFGQGNKSINSGAMSFNNLTVNSNVSTLTITGTVDVNGNLAISSANTVNGGTIAIAGNFSSSDTTVYGTTAITLDGTGAQTINMAGGADIPEGTFTINKSSGTATLLSNISVSGTGQDVTVTSGTLDLAGFNLVLTGPGDVLSVANGATLQLQGGETITATTKTLSAGSTVIYNGGGSYTGLAAGNAYHHLTFNGAGTWTLNSALDANGNLTITSGTLATGGNNINVAGNWGNSGTFTHGAATVTLDGTAQNMNGSTTFYNLTKSVAAAETLTFQAGQTTTIATGGTLTLNGASGQLLSLRSSVNGTRWNLVLQAGTTKAVSYVSVKDSDASGSAAALKPVNPTNSSDAGNTLQWFAYITLDGNISEWCDGSGTEFCVDDQGGADDWTNPAKLDITRYGVASNRADTFYVLFGFDDTSLANQATACVLMDTDNPANNNIDRLVCVVIDNGPTTVTSVEMYTCDDTLAGGCENPVLAKTYTATDYALNNATVGPFGNNDTFVEMAMPYTDLALSGGNVIFTSLVSYPGKTFLQAPKDSIFGNPTQNYNERIQYDLDGGSGGTVGNPGTPVLSGYVFTDEGTTPIGSGKTVRLIKNGASVGTDVTDTSGGYYFATSVNANDALLVYIDGNDGATTDATTVTLSNGASLSDLDLYVDHLVTRHDNSGSLTNALMNTAKGAYSDTEILYSVSAGNLTVSGSATELYLPTGHSFAPGGDVATPNLESKGTFSGGSGAIDINGALLISGGSFTATSGTTFISGNFTLSAGSFTHNSGSITFDNVGTKTVDIGATNLNNVTLNMTTGTDLAVTGTMNVNGNLTLTTLQAINTGTIAVSGNVVTTDTSVSGAGVILFTGSGAQTLSAGGASGALPGVSINKSGGSLTIQDTIEIDGSSGWTYTAGTVVTTGSTVDFQGGSKTVDSGAMAFNNVIISMGGSSLTVTGTMDVNGNLTITSVNNIDTGTIAVAGNVATTDAAVSGTGRILFDGGGAQTLQVNGAGGTGGVPAVQINKGGGTLTIRDVISVGGFGAIEEWEHIVGAVDASASTILFDFGTKTITPGSMTFNNVTLNMGNNGLTVTTGTLDINGDLTITTASAVTGAITLAGNLSSADTTVSGTGTITLDGAGAQTIDTTGGGDLPNGTLTINKASGTATLASNLTLNGAGQDLIVTAGTLDLVNYNLSVADQLRVNAAGTLRLIGSGTVSYTTGTLDPGSTVVYYGTAGPYTVHNAGYQNLVFDGAGGTFNLGATLLVNQNLTINAGTLDLAGYNTTVTGTFSNNDTLRLQGSELLTGTMDVDSGTTVYYGSGAYANLAAGNAYYNLTFNGSGSWTHTGALDANGNLNIIAGTLNSGGRNVNVAGNWSNTGTYTSGANTVTLDGTNQSLSGNTPFNNFTKSVASAATLTFAAGSTQTFNGTVTLNGVSGQLLSLRSSSSPTRWNFNVSASATKAISYVDVQDSDASGSAAGQKMINPTSSFDSGNNVDWFSLSLVKQVWQVGGSAPLAKTNGAPSSTTVPSGETVVFLIYVKNSNLSTVSDIRFSDLLDVSASGFDYVAGSLVRDDGSLSDAATDLAIFNATAPGTGTALTDAVDGDIASVCDSGAGACPGTTLNRVTVGNTTGLTPAQANGILSIAANKTFAIRFRAVKK